MSKDIVMLSKYIQDVTDDKLVFPMHVSEKLDGVMADIYKDYDGDYHIRTRQGKPIPSMQWLVERLKACDLFDTGEHAVGELYHDYGLPRVKNFNKISGRIRQEQEQAYEIGFYMFDFYSEERDEIYQGRLNDLLWIWDKCEELQHVPFIGTVNNKQELVDMFERYMQEHPTAEGVVARPVEGTVSYYKVGRSYGFIKIVPKPTVDLAVNSIVEAEGDMQGHAGKVMCTYNDKEIPIGLSGLTHDIRKDMFINPDKYIGKIVEVKYKDITDTGVMRMPVVVRFREDKE